MNGNYYKNPILKPGSGKFDSWLSNQSFLPHSTEEVMADLTKRKEAALRTKSFESLKDKVDSMTTFMPEVRKGSMYKDRPTLLELYGKGGDPTYPVFEEGWQQFYGSLAEGTQFIGRPVPDQLLRDKQFSDLEAIRETLLKEDPKYREMVSGGWETEEAKDEAMRYAMYNDRDLSWAYSDEEAAKEYQETFAEWLQTPQTNKEYYNNMMQAQVFSDYRRRLNQQSSFSLQWTEAMRVIDQPTPYTYDSALPNYSIEGESYFPYTVYKEGLGWVPAEQFLDGRDQDYNPTPREIKENRAKGMDFTLTEFGMMWTGGDFERSAWIGGENFTGPERKTAWEEHTAGTEVPEVDTRTPLKAAVDNLLDIVEMSSPLVKGTDYGAGNYFENILEDAEDKINYIPLPDPELGMGTAEVFESPFRYKPALMNQETRLLINRNIRENKSIMQEDITKFIDFPEQAEGMTILENQMEDQMAAREELSEQIMQYTALRQALAFGNGKKENLSVSIDAAIRRIVNEGAWPSDLIVPSSLIQADEIKEYSDVCKDANLFEVLNTMTENVTRAGNAFLNNTWNVIQNAEEAIIIDDFFDTIINAHADALGKSDEERALDYYVATDDFNRAVEEDFSQYLNIDKDIEWWRSMEDATDIEMERLMKKHDYSSNVFSLVDFMMGGNYLTATPGEYVRSAESYNNTAILGEQYTEMKRLEIANNLLGGKTDEELYAIADYFATYDLNPIESEDLSPEQIYDLNDKMHKDLIELRDSIPNNISAIAETVDDMATMFGDPEALTEWTLAQIIKKRIAPHVDTWEDVEELVIDVIEDVDGKYGYAEANRILEVYSAAMKAKANFVGDATENNIWQFRHAQMFNTNNPTRGIADSVWNYGGLTSSELKSADGNPYAANAQDTSKTYWHEMMRKEYAATMGNTLNPSDPDSTPFPYDMEQLGLWDRNMGLNLNLLVNPEGTPLAQLINTRETPIEFWAYALPSAVLGGYASDAGKIGPVPPQIKSLFNFLEEGIALADDREALMAPTPDGYERQKRFLLSIMMGNSIKNLISNNPEIAAQFADISGWDNDFRSIWKSTMEHITGTEFTENNYWAGGIDVYSQLWSGDEKAKMELQSFVGSEILSQADAFVALLADALVNPEELSHLDRSGIEKALNISTTIPLPALENHIEESINDILWDGELWHDTLPPEFEKWLTDYMTKLQDTGTLNIPGDATEEDWFTWSTQVADRQWAMLSNQVGDKFFSPEAMETFTNMPQAGLLATLAIYTQSPAMRRITADTLLTAQHQGRSMTIPQLINTINTKTQMRNVSFAGTNKDGTPVFSSPDQEEMIKKSRNIDRLNFSHTREEIDQGGGNVASLDLSASPLVKAVKIWNHQPIVPEEVKDEKFKKNFINPLTVTSLGDGEWGTLASVLFGTESEPIKKWNTTISELYDDVVEYYTIAQNNTDTSKFPIENKDIFAEMLWRLLSPKSAGGFATKDKQEIFGITAESLTPIDLGWISKNSNLNRVRIYPHVELMPNSAGYQDAFEGFNSHKPDMILNISPTQEMKNANYGPIQRKIPFHINDGMFYSIPRTIIPPREERGPRIGPRI